MEVDIIGSLNCGVEVKFVSLICVVEIKSCPGTCRVWKLIIIGSLICVVEIKSYSGTCRVWKLILLEV